MGDLAQNNDGALDWGSTIVKDDEYIILPEGTYNFTVESIERGRFEGSEKLSACPQANLTLRVSNPIDGTEGKVFESLKLHSKMEWKLSQFFASIGQKKKGEPLVMNWNTVPGSTGTLELEINHYTKNDGSKGENNRVKKFLPKEQKSFVPGKF